MPTVTNEAWNVIPTRCLIVGGGPAGIMCAYLLARAGVNVVVLEKHADFNRDFRGDTIHPSTLDLLYELDLLDEFLKLPHQEVREISGVFNGHHARIADFSRLRTHCKFLAFMPQWDFLNFFAEKAKRFPTFTLHMQHEVTDLLFEPDPNLDGVKQRTFADGRVIGVRANTPQGEKNFRADLVIGADGRHSVTHTRGGFELRELGVPIDVLWMHISKRAGDPENRFGFFRHGKLLVLIDRDDYYQAGFVIPKGGIDKLKARGVTALHSELIALAPFLHDRIAELDNWNKIRLLTVQINRLRKWARTGLLCIGDSAHAMSPAGGVGINLALQDAVATANLLADKLRSGQFSLADLEDVQRRREWPTRLIQNMQMFVHRHVVTGRESIRHDSLPILVRLVNWFPALASIPARFIGIGPRPEHIRSPAIY